MMNFIELFDLLGHSHKNKKANEKLNELGFNIISSEDYYVGVPFSIDYSHNDLNIKLNFTGYNYYKSYYGEPLNYIEKNEHELIFKQIMFKTKDCGLATLKEVSSPFKFQFTDSRNTIFDLIRNDYNYIINSKGIDYINFSFNNYQIVVMFRETMQIETIFISLEGIESKTRKKLELELDLQKENIQLNNLEELSAIKNPIPDLDWNYQSDLGPKKSKEIVSDIYQKLKGSLMGFTSSRNPIGIYHSVKEAIVELNNAVQIGLKIDTDERELLCMAIDRLVDATGFDTNKIDVTLKWRKW